MRTGPQGAERPEPQGDQRERDRRPAATAPSAATAVVFAAVEASPAPCRAQRRAGANFGGRRRERSAAQRNGENDGDGADIIGAPFRAGHCTAHTAARPDRAPPDRNEVEGGCRASVSSESAQSWRETCRLGHGRRCERAAYLRETIL